MHLPIKPEIVFYIGNIPITETVVYTWVIMGIMVIGAIFLRIATVKAYKANGSLPVGIANVTEIIVGGINDFSKNNLHHHWKPFAPYIGALGLFLAIANTIGMFGFGIKPPTSDFNLPAALAIMTIVIVTVSTIWYKGLFGYIKTFFEPVWWIFPFRIIEVFARLISLTVRLFGNILAAFILMELIIQFMQYLFTNYIFITAGVPAIFSLYFDIFDGLLQAFIFTFLTTLYLAEGLE